MKFAILIPLLIAASTPGATSNLDADPSSPSGTAYPVSPKGEVVDTYHGVTVSDPFRWLEENEAAATLAWVEQENKVTQEYLAKCPSRDEFRKRLTEVWNYDKVQPPTHRGNRYFFTRLSGLQNQSVLYCADSARGDNAKPLVDPNLLTKDGTTSLAGYSVSDDGKIVGYGLHSGGSDWTVWQFIDVESGKDLPDKLEWIKFGAVSFTADGKGLFYGRYPESTNKLKDSNYFQKIYFHKMGTNQKEDVLIAENKDEKEWSFAGSVTEDGRYLVIEVHRSTNPENLVYFKDLSVADSPLVHLIDTWGNKFSFIESDGPLFFFHTDQDAPRGRIVQVDTSKFVATKKVVLEEIVPQAENILRLACFCNQSLVVHYLKDAHSELKLFDLKGKPAGDVALPGIGTASAFSARNSDPIMFYSFASFTTPTTVYQFDMRSKKTDVVAKPVVKFDPAQFVTSQVFFNSKDGTRVPMFITRKKDVELSAGPRPTYLYGYGGFDVVISPGFRPDTIAWMEKGGLFAVPNIRGGGEYGEDWHKAGMKENKQNVFDDFASAARWLIDQKYTSSKQLAIHGASNGGLLVGATLTQHPELCAAAVPEVGVLDMLRFHRFTIGHAWTREYGCADDSAAFQYLRAYSPLHNIRPQKYPATLMVTGDHDDRVVPAHSFKFAAALQQAQTGDAPILIRVETKTGHGFGKPTRKQIDESADKWTFMWENTLH